MQDDTDSLSTTSYHDLVPRHDDAEAGAVLGKDSCSNFQASHETNANL